MTVLPFGPRLPLSPYHDYRGKAWHSTRPMTTRECLACQHTWRQPALTGACPVCHVDNGRILNYQVCKLPRT